MPVPKIIHSCWFGGRRKPELVRRCQKTWHSGILHGYDFMEWNEDNVNIESEYFEFIKRQNIWAYCADIARLWALYHHGGVYLDSDCEIVRPFDAYRQKELVMPLSAEGYLYFHVILAAPKHPFIKEMLDFFLDTKILHYCNGMKLIQFLSHRHIKKYGKAPAYLAHTDVFHPYGPDDYRNHSSYRGTPPPATRIFHISMASWEDAIKTNIDKKQRRGFFGFFARKTAKIRKLAAIQKIKKQYPGLYEYSPIDPSFMPQEERTGGILE